MMHIKCNFCDKECVGYFMDQYKLPQYYCNDYRSDAYNSVNLPVDINQIKCSVCGDPAVTWLVDAVFDEETTRKNGNRWKWFKPKFIFYCMRCINLVPRGVLYAGQEQSNKESQ
jgi:5-methylcytosine-specific restriction endonuclease McrA